jgi:ABC-type oligopeptide transport system substrate-binding subunit
MKKKVFFILMIVGIALSLFACSSSSGTSADNTQTGQNYINDFFDGNYKAMMENYEYDSKMQQAVSEEFLQQTAETLYAQVGQVTEKGEIQSKEQSGYNIVYEIVSFETTDLTMNVTFDKDGLIAGFTITPTE